MSYTPMGTMQDYVKQELKQTPIRECICGEEIAVQDDLCEACLGYCAKALDVDSYTYEDKMGESRYYDVIRYAHEYGDDLRMNKNNMYWTIMDF